MGDPEEHKDDELSVKEPAPKEPEAKEPEKEDDPIRGTEEEDEPEV
jgi:hypothetical protein